MNVQQNLQRALVDQFHHPRGVLGGLAGRIMARRESNLARNRWTVDLLDLAPEDHVLELGPGPGVTLGVILERVPAGFVVGVDHSATMIAQCRRANRTALRDKRLMLIQGSFTQLPELPGLFDVILAVNSLQFDALAGEALAQIATHLKPSGTMAITLQPRGANASDANAMVFAENLVQLLERAGLTQPRIETLPLEPVGAVCVLARR